jgi:hypothetical protein
MLQVPVIADPSSALYWQIGDTAIRLASVTPPRVIGSKGRLIGAMGKPRWLLLRSYLVCRRHQAR